MIEIIRLWETVNQLAKTETSGYQNEDEFNNDVKAVQDSLMSLSSVDGANQSWIDIFDPFAKSESLSINSQGIASKPTDYYRGRTGEIDGQPCYPIKVNEKDMFRTSAIRNTVNVYYQEDGVLKFLPTRVATCNFSYLRKPLPASIVLTPVSTPDEDYLTPTVGADLEWDDNVFNLFVYMMLERLGVEMKDTLSREFANFGIQRELAKT